MQAFDMSAAQKRLHGAKAPPCARGLFKAKRVRAVVEPLGVQARGTRVRRPEPWWRLNAARDDVTTTETFVSTAPDANFVSSSSESAADSPAETSPMTAAASSAGVPAGVPVVPDATAGAVPGLSETQEMRETLEAALARPSEPTPEEGEESGGVKFMGMELKGSIKGMLLLNLGAALFGCNQVVIKEAEEILSPASLSALRFVIAAACFAPAAARALEDKELRKSALELGAWLFAGYTMQAIGLAETSAARSAVTGTFTVLTVPFLVGLSGRRIPVSTWIAAVAALLGVGLLVGDPRTADPNFGDVWCIGSAIMFGMHKFRTESVTTRFADKSAELMSLQLAVLAGAASLYALPEFAGVVANGGLDGVVEAAAGVPWVAVLWMGLATTAFTLYIEVESLKEVSAPLAALIYTSEPLWGALLAWFVLDERWGATGWVGAAMIIGSSLYSQLGGDKVEKIKAKDA